MKLATVACTFLIVLLQPGFVGSTENAVRAEASRLFLQGIRVYRQGRYLEAMTYFERTLAYRTLKNALWNAAGCQLQDGNRDMTVWFMERYLEADPRFRACLEFQQALAAVAGEVRNIPEERRYQLAQQINRAQAAVEDGTATQAEPSQQIYGTGRSSPGSLERSLAARETAARFFRDALGEVPENALDTNLTLFERSLAYRRIRNAAYNIAAFHLEEGHRDLSAHFYRMYIYATPEVQQDDAVMRALEAVEDSPPHVGNQARRNELADQMELAVRRVLGDARPPSAVPQDEHESATESPEPTSGAAGIRPEH